MNNSVKIFSSILFAIAVFAPLQRAHADVSGRWSCHFNLSGSGDYPQDFLLTESGGTITGSEVSPGQNTPFADLAGTISGNKIDMRSDYTKSSGAYGYFAIISGIVSGSSMSGSWHNNGQAGGFTCTQTSSTAPTATPTPISVVSTPVPTLSPINTTKRPTAISLFCNRTGVGLSVADCAVTVGDAGAPPRSAPTGLVNFVASNGFFPSAASCYLIQTPYSPGVVSCKAEFAVPLNFPIGIAFPIDATYEGDSVFASATTSHATIQAGCIGTRRTHAQGQWL